MFIFIQFGIAIAALPNANISMGPLIQSQGDIEDLDQIVYLNYKVMENFNYDSFPSLSCCPNNVTKYRVMELNPNGSQIQQFNIPFFIENLDPDPLYVASLNITELFSYQDIPISVNYSTDDPINFGPKQYLTLKFTHFCNKTLNKDRYWSIKKVSLELKGYDPVTFNYQFLCGNNYFPVRFDWSNIILIIAESIIILGLSIFGKIYAFKIVFITKQLKQQLDKEKLERIAMESKPFQGFSLSWYQALLYMGLLLGALFISLYLQEKAERPIQIIIYVLCCFCTFHFVNELFSCFRKQIPFFVKPILFFRVCDVLSLAIGAALIILYLVIDQIWILSNLITICILGSLIKLLKIKSLKKSLLFFLPIMAIDVFCSIYLALTIRYEWDSLILRYFNTPLSAQIPYFRYIYKKKCAWVSIFNILFPGFFLAYVHRFDKHKQTLVYEIVSFIGLLIGLVLWVVIQYLTSFPLPTSIFTEVLMILFCTLIAFRRNQLNLFWTGDYYDEILYDPFKNELDKKSIKVISFFNMGVSKEVIKKYAVNSQVERVATQYVSFELVRENKPGELVLDSILFEGLYSIHEEQIFQQSDQHNSQHTSRPTIETNQRKEINSAERDKENGTENEPLIQQIQSLKRSGVRRPESSIPKIQIQSNLSQEINDPLIHEKPDTKLNQNSQTLQQNKGQEQPQINGSLNKQQSQHQEPLKVDDTQSKKEAQQKQSAFIASEKPDVKDDLPLSKQHQQMQESQKNQQNQNQPGQFDVTKKFNENEEKIAPNNTNEIKDQKGNQENLPDKKPNQQSEKQSQKEAAEQSEKQQDKQSEKQPEKQSKPEKQSNTQIEKQQEKQQEKSVDKQPEKQSEKQQEKLDLLKPQQIGRKVESIIDPKGNNQQKTQPKQQPPPQQPPQVSQVSQKYPITQTAKPPEDRFKQKQQLRAQPQSDVFKRNLEFFQKQEQAQNYRAPVKK